MAGDYVAENAQARERLRALIASLSDDDLVCPLGEGRTVATALAHLVFWDARYLALLRRWQREGVAPAPVDSDTVNDALLTITQAVPPRTAAQLALAAAERLDDEIERLPAALAAQIEAAGHVRVLRRFLHRQEHLEQIERAFRA